MLATKVTALLSAPLLVLMIDAPFRSGWRVRHWIAAIASLIVLAGPWYVRNVVLTGNPLYPTDVRLFGVTIFEGMMTPIRSRKLEGWKGWDVLTAGYFAMPVWPAWSLIAGWVVALVRRARMVGLDPVTRVAILGPVIGIALFWGKSPYAEMRFVYPSLLLLFGCVAAGMTRMGWGSILAGAFVVAVSLATSFKVPQNIVMFALVGLILAGMGALLAAMLRRVPTMMRVGTVGIILLLPIAILLANWRGYVIDGYRKNVNDAWLLSDWGELAEAWTAIRTNVPRDEVLAYTNAYLVYPLYDFELDRRIVYAPTQPGVSRLHDLPHFTRPTPGEDIPWRVEEVTWMGADRDTWLKNLDRTGATYLFIETRPIGNPEAPSVVPPELTFARQMPERFQQVFANDRAVIFRIKG